MSRRMDYERDDTTFPANAYAVSGHPGIAWYVLGWKLAPIHCWQCVDCERSGYERPNGGGAIIEPGNPECDHEHIAESDEPDYERTGEVVCVMVGDDHHWTFDPGALTPIARESYCGECGQIGCCADGLHRE